MVRGGMITRGNREGPREPQTGQEGRGHGTGTEDTGGVAGTEGGDSREPTLVDIASILRAHMGQQEARDNRLREESDRQEQRFKALQHQFQLLQLEVQACTSPTLEHTSADLDSDEPGPQAQIALTPEGAPANSSSGMDKRTRPFNGCRGCFAGGCVCGCPEKKSTMELLCLESYKGHPQAYIITTISEGGTWCG
ncbi:uncharacterized protein LOC127361776 isoform X5 [Dicentrarchus labrax]|uniref:uncharacterized protein LOC127361776 isoform X3 n=1 Tax=Dicentrarchus labrax TaxID=13489 RepID=UPI0021F5FDDE|nr:uncharacterized protein LOC127361776 isoform X3 [Dicentrarchus labrax]XP_051252641.1 uncharacterized protein LOC127361776 isoform X4 [Dicentrarchus labrax]XP_051252642.1 uncharacterized protein LOC127361776 isoform X5 [Dicentrarchus labrax]